jgi:DNA polymerase-3 subunit epsilon
MCHVYHSPFKRQFNNGDHMKGPLPKGNFRFVALDVETANGDSASICQIGIACVDARDDIHTWMTYVDPVSAFEHFNTQLHGISAQTVKGAPNFAELWPTLLPFLSAQPLVQHSRFDEYAINAACEGYALKKPRLIWHDSVKIARKAWPEFKGNGGHGLASLKEHLHLEFEHHDAQEDARAAAMVVLRAERVCPQADVIEALNAKPFQLSWQF